MKNMRPRVKLKAIEACAKLYDAFAMATISDLKSAGDLNDTYQYMKEKLGITEEEVKKHRHSRK